MGFWHCSLFRSAYKAAINNIRLHLHHHSQYHYANAVLHKTTVSACQRNPAQDHCKVGVANCIGQIFSVLPYYRPMKTPMKCMELME